MWMLENKLFSKHTKNDDDDDNDDDHDDRDNARMLCRVLDLTAAVTNDVNDHVRCFFSSNKILSPAELWPLF